jgi:aryl-alcohol dehydrogenase-like predicted oxidoreductase
MKRRDLVRLGALAAGTSFLDAGRFPHALFAAERRKAATDTVTLGRTGIAVSRLAQGTGTHGYNKSSDQIRGLGFRGLADLLEAGVDEGLAFWDLADGYGSHPHAKEALKSVRRERVVIMTKTRASSENEMRADLDRFRSEIGVDRIDIVLLHCMMEDDWPRRKAGAMAVLSEAKQKGIIRAHGVSCHTLGALKTAAATDWVEIDLARLNPAGAHMDADPATVIPVLREMKSKGKAVIGMKLLGQGDLRARVDEALQYALAQDVLDCFTIGATSRAELRGLIQKIPVASVRA